MQGMPCMENQSTRTAVPKKEFRVLRRLILAGAGSVIALGVIWFVTRSNDQRVFSIATLPHDNRPAFIASAKPTIDTGPLSNLTLRKTISGIYLKLKNRIAPPKPNPAGYRFAPRAEHSCKIHGLLDECCQVTGTRYLVAREARGDSIDFGHAKTLNGTQWVAAFEEALQRNGYDVVRERFGAVKIIPQNLVAEYEKAGLVKRGK
jgi:hypothetical protein